MYGSIPNMYIELLHVSITPNSIKLSFDVSAKFRIRGGIMQAIASGKNYYIILMWARFQPL